MNNRRMIFLALLVIIGAWLTGCGGDDGAEAQTTAPTHPLLQMLALIPDTAEAREWVSYADYAAIVTMRPGAAQPATWEEYEALHDSNDATEVASAALWRAALMGIHSGSPYLLQAGIMGTEMRAAVGFTILDVERSAAFLPPPRTVTLLQGNFDATAMAAAFTSRGYSSQEYAGGRLWCGPDGCESGLEQNFAARNVANPFGGQLGRNQPLLAWSDYLISSADFAVLDDYPGIVDGSIATLADAPDYQAAVSAITQTGALIHAEFYAPTWFIMDNSSGPATRSGQVPAEVIEQLRERYQAGYVPLPPYSLAVFADTVDGDDQVTFIGLVYADAETAQAAADIVYARVNEHVLFSMGGRPLTEILADRDIVMDTPQLYTHAATGRTVMLIPWRAPLPPQEPNADTQMYTVSSLIFRLIYEMVIRRDMIGLLAIEAGEAE